MRTDLAWLALALIGGCAAPVPTAPVDVGARTDTGHDASTIDAGHDASELDAGDDAAELDVGTDANDLDAGTDAGELDVGTDANDLDAGDDAAPFDAGPFDAGIVRTSAPPIAATGTPIAPFTACTVTTSTDAISGEEHHPPCDFIPYPYYPPSAGPHYWSWAAFETFASPVPWGFLVHDLEHGAVILAYHCQNDADCDPVRAEYASIIADMGVDPVCSTAPTTTRFLVVPDPMLPAPIVVVAWEHVYEATCLDDASLRAFVAAHYGMGPESLCAAGLEAPDGGTWCP